MSWCPLSDILMSPHGYNPMALCPLAVMSPYPLSDIPVSPCGDVLVSPHADVPMSSVPFG